MLKSKAKELTTLDEGQEAYFFKELPVGCLFKLSDKLNGKRPSFEKRSTRTGLDLDGYKGTVYIKGDTVCVVEQSALEYFIAETKALVAKP